MSNKFSANEYVWKGDMNLEAAKALPETEHNLSIKFIRAISICAA